MIQQLLKWPMLFKFLLKYCIRFILGMKLRRNIQFSNTFLLFSVESNKGARSYFEVGRMAIRAWLILTKHGLNAQPHSLASISILDGFQHEYPRIAKDNASFFKKGRDLLQKEFNTSDEAIPVWILRFGKPMNQDPILSNRKTINDLKIIKK